jgi:hemerythrin-like domain-containing protein
MDAVEFLIGQHRALEARMKRLKEAEEPSARVALLAEVGDHLTIHIESEEQLFYPAVKAKRTEDILMESLEEHLSLKRLLADLLALAPDDTTFKPKFQVLKEQTEHHHKEEEEKLFPKVLTLLDDAERATLGTRMVSLQERLLAQGRPRETVVDQTAQAAPLD